MGFSLFGLFVDASEHLIPGNAIERAEKTKTCLRTRQRIEYRKQPTPVAGEVFQRAAQIGEKHKQKKTGSCKSERAFLFFSSPHFISPLFFSLFFFLFLQPQWACPERRIPVSRSTRVPITAPARNVHSSKRAYTTPPHRKRSPVTRPRLQTRAQPRGPIWWTDH